MPNGHDCGGCPRALDRRTFMREAALAAAAMVMGLGAVPELLAAELPEVTAGAAAGAARSYAIPADDGASIDAENEVLLVRWEGRAHAFALACPHRGARLQWRESERRVYCPKHKTRFLPDGARDSGRNTRALDRHGITRAGDRLLVQLDVRYRIDRDPEGWQAAVVTL